jgi:hypothetical protein
LPPTPAEHFKLYFYAAVLDVLDHVTLLFDSHEAMLQKFPFLVGYQDQLAACGLEGKSIADGRQWWQRNLSKWEAGIDQHLPLRALSRATGLDYRSLILLITIGLIEEDPRFGVLFDALQGETGQHRPTLGILSVWQDGESDARVNLRRLQQLGLIHIINPDAPRLDQVPVIPASIWDALCGEHHENIASWARYEPSDRLLTCDELIIPTQVQNILQTLPALLRSGDIQTVVVRGPQHNGRHTLVGALARALGRGLLKIDSACQQDADCWRLIGTLSTLLHAVPVVAFDLVPGEIAEVAEIVGNDGPLGVVSSKTGGLTGPPLECAVIISLDIPDASLRRQHWQHAAETYPAGRLASIADRYRLTSGNIYRAAQLAHVQAALAGQARSH